MPRGSGKNNRTDQVSRHVGTSPQLAGLRRVGLMSGSAQSYAPLATSNSYAAFRQPNGGVHKKERSMFDMIAALLVLSAVIGFDSGANPHRPNPPSTEEDGSMPPREFWEPRR